MYFFYYVTHSDKDRRRWAMVRFPLMTPYFFFFLLSSNTFSYIFESIVDVKALLCIFFISCPRNKWFVNGISLSALLSTVFCYQFAWKQSMYAGNAGSRKYRYNSFIWAILFADIWTCTLLQAFDTIWAKKGGILCIPLFCSDSGQWVFDYDSFGKMAQMIIFLSLYVKWTPPLEKKNMNKLESS